MVWQEWYAVTMPTYDNNWAIELKFGLTCTFLVHTVEHSIKTMHHFIGLIETLLLVEYLMGLVTASDYFLVPNIWNVVYHIFEVKRVFTCAQTTVCLCVIASFAWVPWPYGCLVFLYDGVWICMRLCSLHWDCLFWMPSRNNTQIYDKRLC